MRLSRNAVFHVGIASEIFQKEVQFDEALPREERKIHINTTARMFIRKNAKEIAEMYEMIREEETRLIEKSGGYFISSLGYTQFFASSEDLGAFKKTEDEFVQEVIKLREIADDLLQKDTAIKVRLDNDFRNLRGKYIQPGDPVKARENLEAYKTAFQKFLTDEEGVMDFHVYPIKARWFEDTNTLPQAFVDHYEEAGLIDYGH